MEKNKKISLFCTPETNIINQLYFNKIDLKKFQELRQLVPDMTDGWGSWFELSTRKSFLESFLLHLVLGGQVLKVAGRGKRIWKPDNEANPRVVGLLVLFQRLHEGPAIKMEQTQTSSYFA